MHTNDTCRRTSTATAHPRVDITETTDDYRIVVDLPGVGMEAIELAVEDGVLILNASAPDERDGSVARILSERPAGAFSRRFNLGEDIDVDRIGASLKLGVLRITLPKRADTRPRKIEVAG